MAHSRERLGVRSPLMPAARRVLVFNAGSASLKASVLDDRAVEPTARANVEGDLGREDERDVVARLLGLLAAQGVTADSVDAVGHRVVHGGSRLVQPTIVDDSVVAAIADLAPLAPLHNPLAARLIAAARSALPGIPHVATFDTAFHVTLAPEAFVYALPYAWYAEWGYRRYGFHGLSVQWAMERAASLLAASVEDLCLVVAHLGAGCSVSAISQGRSVGTSMGMTPLEGLVMATRAGSVDPGLLLASQRDHGLDPAALLEILEHRSGLLGVSGRSADMREVLAAEPTDERAALAVKVFVRSVAAGIAAAATALPRVDAIVFTGGIGEHAAEIRARIVGRLATLGVPAIASAPTNEDAVLARGPVSVLRIAAREDVIVAREVRRVLSASSSG